MSRLRKPSVIQELTGKFAHDPGRRRVDPEASGSVPLVPPDRLGLDEWEAQAWVDISGALSEVQGVGKHADWISVEAAARTLGKLRRDGYTDATVGQLRLFLSRFGLDPAGRAALATPVPGRPKNEKLAQFAVSPSTSPAVPGDKAN